LLGGQSAATSYLYDNANRVQSVNGVTYTFNANGNLLNDGVNTYAYDTANRLKTMNSGQPSATSYQYNGLGDRLRQTVNGNTTTFTMDLNTGLTQALSDGTNTYVYGLDRIAQTNITATDYFLGDALGSVRQLIGQTGAITYARAYDPYGVVTQTTGASQTAYGYTGEFTSSNLVYLRSRMYSPGMGRFLTRDTWGGDVNNPMSLNRWNYTSANPINRVDPSGHCFGGSWWDIFNTPPYLGWCSSSTMPSNIPATSTVTPSATFTPTCTPTFMPTLPPTLTPIPTLDTEPWKHDKTYPYDPNLKGIPNWGVNWKTDSIDRATHVWSWVCTAGGWWGPGCPSPIHLGAILLNHEVGEYWDDAKSVQIASTTIRYKLGESIQTIQPSNLAFFTAFFNPQSDLVFDESDWYLLTIFRPIQGMIDEMQRVYNNKQDVFRGPNNQPVIFWWEAIDGDNNSNHALYYQYTNRSGKTIKFGY